MSELKATTAQEIVRNEKDCDYMDELFGGVKMPPTQVYLKSEADKVLADKDKEIERLEILCANYRHDCDNLAISNEQAKRAARTLLKKMNHNKYKRCLAMASYWVAVSYQCIDDKHRQRAERHHRKWIELANKFKDKEAK